MQWNTNGGYKLFALHQEEFSRAKEISMDDGIKRIKFEKYREIANVILLSYKLLESGNWDIQFLNQFQISIIQLQQAANQLQLTKQEYTTIIKARLMIVYSLEYMVKQRAEVGSVRKQHYHEVLVHRYQCELDLAEAEDAAAK